MPKPIISKKNREKVKNRAKGRCEYCQILLDCNSFKATKVEWTDPSDGRTIPLYNPRKDTWTEHFGWSEDTGLGIGLTEIGRATVKELKMNREGLVNLRKLLNLVNKHPPSDTL